MISFIRIFITYFYVYTCVCQETYNDEFPIEANFAKAVKCKYYADKTLLAKTFMDDGSEVFVKAPRYFGKSMNIQMLKHFLEIQVDENGFEIIDKLKTSNYQLFQGTRIFLEEADFFKQHFGRYPVLFIDYGLMPTYENYDMTVDSMRKVLRNVYIQHEYLLKDEKVYGNVFKNDTFMKFYDKILNEDLQEGMLVSGFKFLAELIFEHFNKPLIILIDAYDSFVDDMPFTQRVEVTDIMRFLTSSIKPVFQSRNLASKIFCTGIYHISNVEIRMDRRFIEYPFLGDQKYGAHYGLTEGDLFELLRRYSNNLDEIEAIKMSIDRYYNGLYVVGSKDPIYATQSVIHYLKNRITEGESLALRSYWVMNDDGNPPYFQHMMPLFYHRTVVHDLIILLNNGQVDVEFMSYWTPDIVYEYSSIMNLDVGAGAGRERLLALNFLLELGYLTSKNDVLQHQHHIRTLRIPNIQMRNELIFIYRTSVIRQFGLADVYVDGFLNSIDSVSRLDCDKNKFQAIYNSLLELFKQGWFNPESDSDFECYLYGLFLYRFPIHTNAQITNEGTFSPLQIQFQNRHNITIIIEVKLFKQTTHIELERVEDCAKLAIDKVITNDNLLKKYHGKQVVALGLCLGLKESKEFSDQVIGLSYSKTIELGDNIRQTTVLAENKFQTDKKS